MLLQVHRATWKKGPRQNNVPDSWTRLECQYLSSRQYSALNKEIQDDVLRICRSRCWHLMFCPRAVCTIISLIISLLICLLISLLIFCQEIFHPLQRNIVLRTGLIAQWRYEQTFAAFYYLDYAIRVPPNLHMNLPVMFKASFLQFGDKGLTALPGHITTDTLFHTSYYPNSTGDYVNFLAYYDSKPITNNGRVI